MLDKRPMDLTAFKSSVSEDAPPPGVDTAPLRALWWAQKGDWDKAHGIAQEDEGVEAAWVHAYLHRVEGDLSNAGYWYRRAGRPAANNALEAEWAEIATALLRT